MTEADHQISAVMQMLNEAANREIQLRTLLNKMQAELTVRDREIESLKRADEASRDMAHTS